METINIRFLQVLCFLKKIGLANYSLYSHYIHSFVLYNFQKAFFWKKITVEKKSFCYFCFFFVFGHLLKLKQMFLVIFIFFCLFSINPSKQRIFRTNFYTYFSLTTGEMMGAWKHPLGSRLCMRSREVSKHRCTGLLYILRRSTRTRGLPRKGLLISWKCQPWSLR